MQATPSLHPARSSRALALMTAILLLAALARVYNLLQQGLWLDESYTWRVLTDLGPLGAALDDMHPPLYYFLLQGWLALTGDSVLAMRYLSTLAAILTVPLVYALARRVTPVTLPAGRDATAATAALLFALTDADIFMAGEIRMYAVHKLVLVASVLAYAAWVGRPGRGRFIVWVLLNIANLYTYYLGGLLMIAMGLHALLYLQGRRRWQALGGLVVSGVAFLPWALTGVLEQLRTPNPLFLPEPLNAFAWREFLRLYFGGHWALVIGLLLFGAIVVRYRGDAARIAWRPDGGAFLLVLWVILPFAFIALVGLARPFFSPRWPFLVTPGVALLAARGLGNFRVPGRHLLLAVIVVFSLAVVDFYLPKPPWDDVAGEVLRVAAPGDSVLLEIGNDDHSVGYYLAHGLPEGVPYHSLRVWRDETDDAEYDVRLRVFLGEQTSVWLVAWGDDHDIFRQLATAGFVQTSKRTVDHAGNAINIFRYDRPLTGDPLAEYESGLILRRAAFDPATGRADLWWSTAATPDRDYTVSVFLLNAAGQLVTQHDSTPGEGTRPTTTWAPDDLIYDPHFLSTALPPGSYSLGIQTYYWADGAKIPTLAGDPWYTLGTYEMR